MRDSDEEASKLVIWMPTDSNPSRGRRRITYIDNLLQDTGMDSVQELRTIMKDRECWRNRVDSVLERPERRQR